MIKSPITIIICLLFALSVFGQIDELKWEQYLGKKGDKIYQCLLSETANNTVAVFGQGKKELYFFEINQDGKLIKEATLSYPKHTNINAVLPTSDGYLLAGDTRKGGKSYPSLFQLDQSVGSLSPILLERKEQGQYKDIMVTQGGKVMLVGQKKNKMMVFLFDRKTKKTKTFFEAENNNSNGASILEDAMGDFLVAGHQVKNKLPYLTVWKIDTAGILVEAPYVAKEANTKALDFIQLDNRDIFITGHQQKNALFSNILLELAPNLDTSQPFPTPNTQDATKQLGLKTIYTPPNHLLTVGQFHAFGANTSDIWYNWFSMDGAKPLDKVFYESPYNDKATDIIRLANNNYLIAALSGNKEQPSIKLAYYESGKSPCKTDLDQVTKEDYYFISTEDKVVALDGTRSPFKGYLLSRMPLSSRNISITNKTLSSKAIRELSMTQDSTLGEQYCYHLKTNLRLKRNAENEVHLKVLKRNEQVYEQTIHKAYQIEKPNLHLITIGINYKLEHTQQDASDIDALFRTQEGRLFKRVYSHTFNTNDNTTGKSIVDFIDDFCMNKDLPQPVTSKDVILLFVSSHGIIRTTPQGKERFILPAYDYIATNRTTYIDYESDILDKFKDSPGKKIILIDACKSGSKKGTTLAEELDSGIKKILDAPEGFVTLSSSQADQFSYESGGTINNGIFTYAIEEALGLDEKRKSVDANKDKVITVQELFDHLKIRVPEMAKELAADDAEQVPDLNGNDILKQLPIFFIN